MARREVLEVVCDRCDRTETQAKSEVSPANQDEFSGKMGAEEVRFADLCKRCRSAVTNYFDKIRRLEEPRAEPLPVSPKAARLS